MKESPRLVYELFCFTLSARLHAAVVPLHEGMQSGRFVRDNARKGIRAALRVEAIRSGVTQAAARVHHAAAKARAP
jgi:hypothetical protein